MPRWFTYLSKFLARRRAPTFEVTLRRVFVVPTRHGFMAALAIFGVFAIAVRIQNNMLLLMAVALFVIFTLSLLWAGQNLRGLRLGVRHDGQIVAGETSRLSVRLVAARPAFDIRLDTGAGGQPAMDNTQHALAFSPDRRGRHPLPLVRIETGFPFGLARAWAWISPAEVLVAPKPDHGAALAHLTGDASGGAADSRDEAAADMLDADMLDDWTPGTPESRVDWKRYAATDRLLAKTGDVAGGTVLTISYDSVAHLGHERALSAMSAAVLRAARAGRPFHFRLNGIELRHVAPQSAGQALDALALA